MRQAYPVIVSVLLGIALLPSVTLAWSTYYDGGQLPTQQAWTFGGTDISQCSTDGQSLRVFDNTSQATAYFYKTVTPLGQPLTVEARLRVATASDLGTVLLSVANGAVGTWLSFFPGELKVAFGYSYVSYPADFSSFRTVRVAIDSQDRSFVWLDGELLTQGVAQSSQGSTKFGAYSVPGTSDAYWDYVAASPEFLPIPEPSSLLALACGSLGVGGLALRRRNRR